MAKLVEVTREHAEQYAKVACQHYVDGLITFEELMIKLSLVLLEVGEV